MAEAPEIALVNKICKIVDPAGKIIIMWMDEKDIAMIDDEAFTEWGAKATKLYGAIDVVVLARGTDLQDLSEEQLAKIGLRRIEDASKTGQVKESSFVQHKRDDEGWASKVTSDSSGLKQSRQGQKASKEELDMRDYFRRVHEATEHLFNENGR